MKEIEEMRPNIKKNNYDVNDNKKNNYFSLENRKSA